MRKLFIAPVALLLALSGCSSSPASTDSEAAPIASSPTVASTSTSTPTPTPTKAVVTADDVAFFLEDEIAKVEKVVQITEDNDPNDLIGRPNGYTEAAIVFDERLNCGDQLGASCGATVEIWPDEAGATARNDYIQGVLKDSPILGSEYGYVEGNVLLRVSGDLKPSVAAGYKSAFDEFFE